MFFIGGEKGTKKGDGFGTDLFTATSTKNETSLTRAEVDLRNATRDGECLIKGCVPADYIKFIDK